jgi:hypothetical protein
MPKQRQSLATRPVPVLTVEFAFAPSAIPPATFSACLVAVSPTQAPAHINGPIYRNGNAAEMGTAQGELGDGKSILRTQFPRRLPFLQGSDPGGGGILRPA